MFARSGAEQNAATKTDTPQVAADMEHIAQFFSLADLAGHASYVLIAISYYATNIYWLRVMAVLGLTLEIAYFVLSRGALHTGIAWDVVFIAINLYQMQYLVRERLNLRRVSDVGLLRQSLFANLNDAQMSRVVMAGAWRNFAVGDQLTREGAPVQALVLLCEGEADVNVQSKVVAQLHAGTFCGEMAFISGQPASATVVVTAPMRAYVFDMQSIRKLVARDDLVAAAMHQAVGLDLARKVSRNNRMVLGLA